MSVGVCAFTTWVELCSFGCGGAGLVHAVGWAAPCPICHPDMYHIPALLTVDALQQVLDGYLRYVPRGTLILRPERSAGGRDWTWGACAVACHAAMPHVCVTGKRPVPHTHHNAPWPSAGWCTRPWAAGGRPGWSPCCLRALGVWASEAATRSGRSAFWSGVARLYVLSPC